MTTATQSTLFEIRPSPIAGSGAFATRPIRKGTRIVEYVGERISHEEADRRYDDDRGEYAHVLLFTVDRHTVIDAGVGGNEARFINHACEPNCEPHIERGRVFIVALRAIAVGEELTYDYCLERDGEEDPESEARFACRCGSKRCRGTQLEPRRGRKRTCT
jgi:SET domain-containing protein